MEKEKNYTALLQQVGTRQESLKEVAEKIASTTEEFNMFIAGAKWQAERMYNEDYIKEEKETQPLRNGLVKIIQMKKGSYWFSFLSEKEQKEFRENVKNQGVDFSELMNDEYRLFEYFITLAFWYDETPQGHDYWFNIAKRDVQ